MFCDWSIINHLYSDGFSNTDAHTLRMDLLIMYFEGSQMSNNYVLQPLNIVFIIANSEDPEEIKHFFWFFTVGQIPL